MGNDPPRNQQSHLPLEINLLTLNCWGLLHLSALRTQRLAEIGRQIASTAKSTTSTAPSASPTPHIVCLQECWVKEDYEAIRNATRHILPHGKFYANGLLGAGLAILSKWPIIESDIRSYPLNGRPSAFFRGDWYAGKGIASAVIQFGPGKGDVVEVFNTHTHAPYGTKPHSQYTAHRTAQAWLLAKLLRAASQRGHLVLAMGDFNMLPLSFAHRLITSHSPVRDVWRVLHPDSSLGPAKLLHASSPHAAAATSLPSLPTAEYNINVNGVTSDGPYNTWRWPKDKKARLAKGDTCPVDPDTPDPDGKRLDYIFASSHAAASDTTWHVASASVAMTQRHPELLCSLSDHFAVQATLRRRTDNQDDNTASKSTIATLEEPRTDLDDHQPSEQLYDEILAMIAEFTAGEKSQQSWRAWHFYLAILTWIASLVAVWFSPHNYVSFLLMLLASLGLASGVVNGLIALLFFQSEFKALSEFEWDIRNARSFLPQAQTASF